MNKAKAFKSILQQSKRPMTSKVSLDTNTNDNNRIKFSPYREMITCLSLEPQKVDNKIQSLVQETKFNSKQTFLSNINQKNVVKIKEQFINKISDMNVSAEQLIKKEKIQCKECQAEIVKYENLNKTLEDNIKEINNKYKEYENELKMANEEINRLQLRFGLSDKVKPLFEALIKAFPTEDPLQFIIDIIGKRDKNISMITSINTLEDKAEIVGKEIKDDVIKHEKSLEDLNNKIVEINLDSKSKTSKYKKELLILAKDLEAYLVYKKSNVALKDILYKLYLMVIERLKVDRSINIDEQFLKVNYDNFNPELFDNRKLIGYINQMLANYEKDNTIVLLRKTIAYANMMIRIYLNDKKNYLRYDPLKTLIEIKAFNDKTEFDISKLNSINTTLIHEDKENQRIIKELQKELKLRELKYDSLKRKIERQIQGRRVDNITIDKIKETKRMTKTIPYSKKFFLTDTLPNNKSNEKKKKSGHEKPIPEYFKPNSANPSESNIYELSNENSSESSDCTNSFSAKDVDIKKFKDITLSKNKDKLIKSNGYKGMGNFLTGLKNLVDKTNRMEYYQNRIETTMNKLTLSNQFPSIVQSETHLKKFNSNKEIRDKYDTLSQKVISKLDNMILSTRMITDNNI